MLIRKSLKIVLESLSNISVIGVSDNEKEVMTSFKDHLPDVILIDIKMPMSDRLKMITAIKRLNPSQKIIILTTFEEEAYVRFALHAGADFFILRDVKPQILIKGIENLNQFDTLIPQDMATKVLKLTYDQDKLKDSIRLTSQEKDLITDLSKGLTPKDISKKLLTSTAMVRFYISRLFFGACHHPNFVE